MTTKLIPLASIALLALSNVAQAQVTPQLPSRQELQPSPQPILPPTRDSSGLFEQLAVGPCPFTDSDLSLTLRSIKLNGLNALLQSEIESVYANEIDQEISLGELCSIRDRIAQKILRHNILARVEIPEQHIKDGIVTIDVYEARVETIQVVGDVGPVKGLVERILAPLSSLAYLNLDIAQRYLLLASDLPGIQIKYVIAPGTTLGGIQLKAYVSRRPIDGSIAAQNYNSRALGRITGYASVSVNSLTGLGDRTTLLTSVSSDFEEQRIFQLREELRIGASGLIGRGSITLAYGRPGDALESLDLRTRSIVGNVELSYPIIRHRRHNLYASGGIDIANQRTRFGPSLTLTDEKLRVAYGRLSGNLSSNYGETPAYLAGSIELRQGISGLGASSRGSNLMTRPFADPSAFVLRGTAEAMVSPAPLFFISASMIGQYTKNPLLSYEQMGIGNLSIGRGYDPNSVPGDRGVAGSLEMGVGPFGSEVTNISPFVFFDIARVTNLGPSSYSLTAKSVGGGIKARIADMLNASITYAHPLDGTYPGAPRASDRALLSLSLNF